MQSGLSNEKVDRCRLLGRFSFLDFVAMNDGFADGLLGRVMQYP